MSSRILALAILAALALPASAAAQSPPFTSCPVYSDQQICTAQVPSFDGSALASTSRSRRAASAAAATR